MTRWAIVEFWYTEAETAGRALLNWEDGLAVDGGVRSVVEVDERGEPVAEEQAHWEVEPWDPDAEEAEL